MKVFFKKLLVVAAIMAITLSFTSCDAIMEMLGMAPPVDVKAETCTVLGTLVDKNYSEIDLTITTKKNGIQLDSEFKFVDNKVLYTVEKLAKYEIVGAVVTAPESQKIIISGEAMLNDDDNDRNVMIDGEIVNVKNYQTLVGGFNFNPDNFVDFSADGGIVKFKVNNPSSFLGTEIEASDMSVAIEFNDAALKSVTLSYTYKGPGVVLDYDFIVSK